MGRTRRPRHGVTELRWIGRRPSHCVAEVLRIRCPCYRVAVEFRISCGYWVSITEISVVIQATWHGVPFRRAGNAASCSSVTDMFLLECVSDVGSCEESSDEAPFEPFDFAFASLSLDSGDLGLALRGRIGQLLVE